MQFEINANKREAQGTSASRRLRRAGRVPGVVYGGADAAQAIDMDHNELFLSMRHEAFQSSIITLNVEGAAAQVLLRDVQVHPFKRQILHVDFQRVAADQKIHLKVPLHFVNADIAPGVKLGGGIVSHVATELDVQCLPGKLPEYIEVDLKDLVAGHSIHVSDLSFPEGVIPVLHKGENPVVATILGAKAQAEEGEGEGEAQ